MSDFKSGDIVRYAYGETALAQLTTPHAGGWHARHCLGGIRWCNSATMRIATKEDIARARQSEFYCL